MGICLHFISQPRFSSTNKENPINKNEINVQQ